MSWHLFRGRAEAANAQLEELADQLGGGLGLRSSRGILPLGIAGGGSFDLVGSRSPDGSW